MGVKTLQLVFKFLIDRLIVCAYIMYQYFVKMFISWLESPITSVTLL